MTSAACSSLLELAAASVWDADADCSRSGDVSAPSPWDAPGMLRLPGGEARLMAVFSVAACVVVAIIAGRSRAIWCGERQRSSTPRHMHGACTDIQLM